MAARASMKAKRYPERAIQMGEATWPTNHPDDLGSQQGDGKSDDENPPAPPLVPLGEAKIKESIMAKLELSSCPFCGKSQDLEVTERASYYCEEWLPGFAVRCCNCDGWGPSCSRISTAVEAWNKRCEVTVG